MKFFFAMGGVETRKKTPSAPDVPMARSLTATFSERGFSSREPWRCAGYRTSAKTFCGCELAMAKTEVLDCTRI